MGIRTSSFTGISDLHSMIKLTEQLRSLGQRVYPIAADLYEELDDPEVQRTARLWYRDNQLIGFAYINRYQNMVDVFTETEISPTRQIEMMDWLVTCAKKCNQDKAESLSLDATALEDDHERIAFLAHLGFIQQEETSFLMSCPLNQPLPEPGLPDGFSIRPMGGTAELEAYVTLHRAAFGTENMTLPYRQSIMKAPGYLPDLDLVAVAPNGDLAAFCVCQIFLDDSPRAGGQKEGWTDPLGTHPNYRGLGLARALILTGMHLLYNRGIDTALLGTSSTNIAMQRLAEKIGFKLVSNTLFFSKPVE
jgi:mycothiol synthase